MDVQNWPIDRLVHYARNPRKNDPVVDRLCSSILHHSGQLKVDVAFAIELHAETAIDQVERSPLLFVP